MIRMSLRQASESLDIPPDSDAATARSAFLRTLENESFLPSEMQVEALSHWSDVKIAMSSDVESTLRSNFRDNVDLFAGDYWKLAPAERRRRWEDLNAHCDDGPDSLFLKHLEADLGFTIPQDIENPEVKRLLESLVEIYVQRPKQRRELRMKWLAEWKFSQPLYQTLDLIESWSADGAWHTQLDPILVELLQQPKLLYALSNETNASAIERQETQDAIDRKLAFEPFNRDYTKKSNATYSRDDTYKPLPKVKKSAKDYWWLLILLLPFLGLIVEAISDHFRHINQRSDPTYQIMEAQQNPWLKSGNRHYFNQNDFTFEQLELILKYEPGKGDTEPTGYHKYKTAASGLTEEDLGRFRAWLYEVVAAKRKHHTMFPSLNPALTPKTR